MKVIHPNAKLLTLSISMGVALLTALPSLAQTRVLTLDEMFKLADEANPSLASMRSSVQEAEANLVSARSARTPDIDINVTLAAIGNAWVADRDFSNGMNVETPHFGNTFSIAISQILYAGGAIKNSVQMAELSRDMASLSHENARQATHMVIAGYYLDLLQLRNQQLVISKNMAQTRKLVEDIEANYAAGTALKSDVTRYELQLQSLQLSMTQTQSAMDITMRYLTEALGLSPDEKVEPDSTVLSLYSHVEPENFWQDKLQSAPSVQMAQKSLEISRKQTDIAKAGMRPTVALRIEDKLDGPITYEVPVLDKNVNFYYAGVSVSYNLGSVYKQKKKVNQSKVSTATAEANLTDATSRLSASVHAAYVQYEESLTNKQTHEKSVQLAHENYDVIHYRYLNGMALVTDMLDATNQQLSAELNLVNAEIQIVYRHILLLASVGGL